MPSCGKTERKPQVDTDTARDPAEKQKRTNFQAWHELILSASLKRSQTNDNIQSARMGRFPTLPGLLKSTDTALTDMYSIPDYWTVQETPRLNK